MYSFINEMNMTSQFRGSGGAPNLHNYSIYILRFYGKG